MPDFKLHYRAIVLEITGHQPKSRLNGPEQRAPVLRPHNYSHLNFNKDAKNAH